MLPWRLGRQRHQPLVATAALLARAKPLPRGRSGHGHGSCRAEARKGCSRDATPI